LRHDVESTGSRRQLLARAALVAGAAGGMGVLVGLGTDSARSAPSPAQDVRILNFLLLLEYLQHDLYSEALAAGNLTGELLRFARESDSYEREHVSSLHELLGPEARGKPVFRFGDALTREGRFAAAALTLEETAVSGYIGQAANLTPERRVAIARIVSVEARQAAWIRDFAGRLPAPYAADRAKTARAAMETIERTGFGS
jgi:Ferritin-like domain